MGGDHAAPGIVPPDPLWTEGRPASAASIRQLARALENINWLDRLSTLPASVK